MRVLDFSSSLPRLNIELSSEKLEYQVSFFVNNSDLVLQCCDEE